MCKAILSLKLIFLFWKLMFSFVFCFCLGQHLLNGTTHSFELFNEFFQQTHVLAEYATLLATETHENFIRTRNELEKFKIFFDRLAQLEKDTKQGFSRIDKVSKNYINS